MRRVKTLALIKIKRASHLFRVASICSPKTDYLQLLRKIQMCEKFSGLSRIFSSFSTGKQKQDTLRGQGPRSPRQSQRCLQHCRRCFLTPALKQNSPAMDLPHASYSSVTPSPLPDSPPSPSPLRLIFNASSNSVCSNAVTHRQPRAAFQRRRRGKAGG